MKKITLTPKEKRDVINLMQDFSNHYLPTVLKNKDWETLSILMYDFCNISEMLIKNYSSASEKNLDIHWINIVKSKVDNTFK